MIYIVVSISVTACLLSYNQYNVTEIKGNLLVIVTNNKIGNYNKNDLLIVKNNNKELKKGDKVFYYKLKKDKYNINYGSITNINSKDVIINDEVISKNMIAGKDKNITSIPLIGGVLNVLESRLGYLIFIVLPILVAFIYELFEIYKEFKKKSK